VRPGATANNSHQGAMGDAVFLGKQPEAGPAWLSGWRPSTVTCTDLGGASTDFPHLRLGQLGTPSVFASCLPSTGVSVVHVPLVRTDRQMDRLEAAAHVAGVLDLESFRDRSDKGQVRENVNAVLPTLEVDLPVAISIQTAGPEQAFAVSDASQQQPLTSGKTGPRILIGHRSSSTGAVSPPGHLRGAGDSCAQCSRD